MIGGSISKSVRRLAAGGGLVVLVASAGCGSAEDARANNGVPDSAPAGTATIASVPVPANAAAADALARSTTAVSVAGDTLCQVGETRLFSCEIGAKRVSVCGGGSGAVYRYGTPGKVELSSHNLTFANQGYSGGGETQITAENDDYTYTVYSSTVRTSFGEGGNDPEFSSGLVIARGERVIASKTCNRASSVEALAEEVLPTGNFVEH